MKRKPRRLDRVGSEEAAPWAPSKDWRARIGWSAPFATYQFVVNEPVPQGLLDIVEQFPHARPSITEAFERARRWRNKAG
jgi:hypothetical protein